MFTKHLLHSCVSQNVIRKMQMNLDGILDGILDGTLDGENINRELGKIAEWLKVNRLSVNASKSKYMMFRKSINKRLYFPNLKIDDTPMQLLSDLKFLGLTLDAHLNRKQPTDKIANKCSRTIGIINRLKHISPTHIKIILYQTPIALEILRINMRL